MAKDQFLGVSLPDVESRELSVPEVLLYLSRAVLVARRFEPADFEQERGELLRDQLLPAIENVVRLTVKLLDILIEHYQPDVKTDVPAKSMFEFADSAEEDAEEKEVKTEKSSTVVDMCFVGRMELTQSLQELRSTPDDEDNVAVLARCIRCRGAIVNVVTAAEKAICEREQWKPSLSTEPELRESLAVRGIYHDLNQHIVRLAAAGVEDLRGTLSLGRAAVSRSLMPEVRRLVRVSDRNQLEQMEQRLTGWLEREPPGDENGGLVIWEDLKIMSEMLMQVNNRQELIDHDLATARGVLEKLGSPQTSMPQLDHELLEQVSALLGRDPELDRMIGWLESGIGERLARLLSSIEEKLATEEGEPISEESDIQFV